ncbi:MAG TPA: glycosyltransferase [Chitinophagaceae bacterium]|jgi:cellulose synthase/poly-beta-1,6-N-acetylglucosamine synthase-like glycosyltransferase|nr:glycosyltransferase [Chitinophagaceae bacterium]
MFILYITILLFLGYSILIIYYWQSWESTPEFFAKANSPSSNISVIIPARNEEENIGKLLTALQNQTYPKNLFEVIVVNDHSTDNTAEIVKKFQNTALLELKGDNINSHKKKAIDQGVNVASGNLIITTDADCIPSPVWLETIALFHQENNSVFIAAPVTYQSNSSFIEIFQALDFLTLQGVMGASVYKKIHSMCNGANLAYEKKAFFEVEGFKGIDKIASGDDMLLMHKIWKKFPTQINYLKSKQAIVFTKPMKRWKEFFNQRIRWASKARFYNDKRIFWVLLLVYLFNLSFLALLIAGIWDLKFIGWLLLLWVAKTIIEFPFVYSVAKFFDQKSLLKYFFFFQPFHIAYTIIAGWLGQFGKYEWKGRRVK